MSVSFGKKNAALPEGLDDHGSAAANPPEFRCSVYGGRPRPARAVQGGGPGPQSAITPGSPRGLDTRRLERTVYPGMRKARRRLSTTPGLEKICPVTGPDLPPLVTRLTHVVRATSSGALPADSPGPLVALLRREYGTHARTGTHRVTATPHRVYTASHGMEQPQRSHGMRMPS